MAERLLSLSRVAKEEDGAPKESSSPVQAHDVTAEQPLQPDTSWLPLYRVKQKAIDILQAFARSPYQSEDDKRIFLENIIYVCQTALNTGLLQGLEIFFQNIKLVNKVKMMLEKEPNYCLRSPLRKLAMLAIAKLSSVGTVLEGKRRSLLKVCISKVFWLPPDEEMRQRNKYYLLTLDAMDVMLEAMVFNPPPSSTVEELQHILEVLLDLTNSESTVVQERAIGRIRKLSCALARWEDWPVDFRAMQIPILVRLLGRLLCFQFSKERTKYLASRAFYYLFQFVFDENRKMSQPAEFYRGHLRLPVTFLQCCHYLTAQIKALECYLTPCERTFIVLAAIEAMQDSSISGYQAARHFLELAKASPEMWLTDVPSIVRGIHECLEHSSLASDVESLDTLLAVLAHESPSELVCSMLTSTEPYDSTALAVWDQMYSQNNLKSEFWMELQARALFQEHQDSEMFSLTVLYAIRVYKVMLDPTVTQIIELLKEAQMYPKLEFLSLLLTGLSTALESPERVGFEQLYQEETLCFIQARKLQSLLPDIVEYLQHTNKAIRLKTLQVLQNMVHHAERKKVSSIALQYLDQLLPLFDDECSELREYSISLFKQLVEAAVWWHKRKMKKKAWRGVVPLLLHMNEKTKSMAQVSRKALLSVAEILGWEELKQPIQTEHPLDIAECLLEKDGRRAEEYLHQSQLYLKYPQTAVREMAVLFTAMARCYLRNPSVEDDRLSVISIKSLDLDHESFTRFLAARVMQVLRVLWPQRRPRVT